METILLTAEEKMESTISSLEGRFINVRAGRANPNVLSRINVDYYGSPYLPKNYATLHTVPAKSMEY